MGKYKIFMTDCIFPDRAIEERILREIDGELFLAGGTDKETLIREGKDCDAMLNVYVQVPNELLAATQKCRIIVRTGIGLNTIDLAYAAERGIQVANVPDYCIDEVADHTMALFLSGMRKITFLNNQVKSGIWKANNARPIPRLRGMIYGVLGFGNIARQVAERVKAFGLEVWTHDPYIAAENAAAHGVKYCADFKTFMGGVDFLSLHVPLLKETQDIINLETLKMMKKTSLIINTARGPLINEPDLVFALKNGIIGGAALDVRCQEPPAVPDELAGLTNVILTPHAAFVSEEADIELREKSAQEVVRALTAGRPKHWANKSYFK